MIPKNRFNILPYPHHIIIDIIVRKFSPFDGFSTWIADFCRRPTNLQLKSLWFFATKKNHFFLQKKTYKGNYIMTAPMPMQQIQQHQQIANVQTISGWIETGVYGLWGGV